MKQSHRIFRDVSLVVVFCGGFFALVWFANFLQATPEEETSSEFSQYRIEADEATEDRDLDVSLQNLRSMVAKDPYDGRAQYKLAATLFSKIVEAQTVVADQSTDESPDFAEEENSPATQVLIDRQDSTTADSQDPDSIGTEAKDKLQTLVDQAIHEYQLAEKHIRYRQRSQYQLALLWMVKEDYEAALGSLERFVVGGGVTRSGLGQIEQFGVSYRSGPTRLHADPRFIDLIERETENRILHGNYHYSEGRRRPRRTFGQLQRLSTLANQSPLPTLMQPDTDLWNFLNRLNHDLIPYRIKLVDFIRVLFKKVNIVM